MRISLCTYVSKFAVLKLFKSKLGQTCELLVAVGSGQTAISGQTWVGTFAVPVLRVRDHSR
eukprot:3656311-Rhodomonas_salina.2